MKKDGSDHVYLSVTHLDGERIKHRFPNIYKQCLDEGYDMTKEPIPVTPAQHYFMGGIKVNLDSKTSMEHLYAVGETSCNGVHGRIVWQVIHYWKHLYLPRQQRKTSQNIHQKPRQSK